MEEQRMFQAIQPEQPDDRRDAQTGSVPIGQGYIRYAIGKRNVRDPEFTGKDGHRTGRRPLGRILKEKRNDGASAWAHAQAEP
jgi:hypothetical protein